MASKQGYGPDLKKYMDKRLDIRLNAARRVVGILRGYDQFMNIVLEDAQEVISKEVKTPIGTVMIRGNSIVLWECLDKII
jgi:small nuclear ribonucleoprotein G